MVQEFKEYITHYFTQTKNTTFKFTKKNTTEPSKTLKMDYLSRSGC